MSTLAEITIAIDDNIRNKTPLVVKTEHADVDQLIADQLFPDSVKIEWNGTSAVDPITDIEVSGNISSADNVEFKIYFWKKGNTVYINGYVKNLSSFSDMEALPLAEFLTNIYKPLVISPIKMNLISRTFNKSVSVVVFANNLGIFISSGLPSSTKLPDDWLFNGSYKVAN
jgi:hypothetical protein